MRVEVAVMQFGEPYHLGREERISGQDGVHLGIVDDDGNLLVNLRMDPAQAMEIAQNIARAASTAQVNAAKLEGKGSLAALASLATLHRAKPEDA
jgi:uncharacterized protein GlcG (DUF336 family)